MKSLLRSILRHFGYDLVHYHPQHSPVLCSLSDLTKEAKSAVSAARPFTMTSVERMATLVNAVNYITENRIEGDIAECGVWRGGSMMVIAMMLLYRNDLSRSLYMYDTFEGMTSPSRNDISFDGSYAEDELKLNSQTSEGWCSASMEEVRTNILSTGYPEDKLHFIKGKVEDTIPAHLPSNLSLLRLDTDWYESTKHELIYLYPLLNRNGALIIDDYGHWQGAKKAVDEYFAAQCGCFYLHRIDYTGRILIKPHN